MNSVRWDLSKDVSLGKLCIVDWLLLIHRALIIWIMEANSWQCLFTYYFAIIICHSIYSIKWTAVAECFRSLDRELQVWMPPTPLWNLGKFIYPRCLSLSDMLLVYQKRMAVGINPCHLGLYLFDGDVLCPTSVSLLSVWWRCVLSYISYTSHCLMEMCPVLHKFHFSLFDGDVLCPT